MIINGTQLRELRRKKKIPSAEELAEIVGLSASTVYRAEQGKGISAISADQIARALDIPVSVLLDDMKNANTTDVSGTWTGFSIEDDRSQHPYVVEDQTELRQSGSKIEGHSTYSVPGEERKEVFVNTFIEQNVVRGGMDVLGWPSPAGSCVFCVNLSMKLDWAEGFITWFDPDSSRTEVSRLIWVRNSSSRYEYARNEAAKLMTEEVKFFTFRKLFESQRAFETAIRFPTTRRS